MSLLNTQEYADLYDVSRRTVQRWVSVGLIFGHAIERTIYIDSDEEPPNFGFQSGDTASNVDRPAIAGDFGGDFVDEEEEEEDFANGNFEPEPVDEIDEDEEECRDPDDFERKDLRKSYQTKEEAENYASDIPVSTVVFKRCSDGHWQVAIEY